MSKQNLICNYETVFNPIYNSQRCSLIAKQVCAPTESFINFYSIYFCGLNEMLIIYIIILILIIMLIFKLMSSIVEEYIAPAISYISEVLELSEALSAVTLLALANGAGDVITALVASGSSGG